MNKNHEYLDASINNRAISNSESQLFYVKYAECYGNDLNLDEIKKMVALDILIYSHYKLRSDFFHELDKLINLPYEKLDKMRMDLVAKNTERTKEPFELVDYKAYEKKLLINYIKHTDKSKCEDCMIVHNPTDLPLVDLLTNQLPKIKNKIKEMQESNNTKHMKPLCIKESLFKQILDKENQ